jgi:hypothetical protein
MSESPVRNNFRNRPPNVEKARCALDEEGGIAGGANTQWAAVRGGRLAAECTPDKFFVEHHVRSCARRSGPKRPVHCAASDVLFRRRKPRAPRRERLPHRVDRLASTRATKTVPGRRHRSTVGAAHGCLSDIDVVVSFDVPVPVQPGGFSLGEVALLMAPVAPVPSPSAGDLPREIRIARQRVRLGQPASPAGCMQRNR